MTEVLQNAEYKKEFIVNSFFVFFTESEIVIAAEMLFTR